MNAGSKLKGLTRNDKLEHDAWLELVANIRLQTQLGKEDLEQSKEDRIKELLKPKNFEKFCRWYFPHYIDSDFGWFHKKAAHKILTSDDVFAVLEWAREHAKSVFADVFIPMWLKAKGELTGMILASDTEPKAKTLLGDIEAELVGNQRFNHDFGNQHIQGSHKDGKFTTGDGKGFWSFGIGQNPAGVRKAAKRPNYGVIDDASTKKRAKNQLLVQQDVDWCLGEFMGCLAIKASRFVFANNRTAKNDLTAHIVGDIEETDPKRDGIIHIKVFATEDPRTHKMLLPENGGVPAWKERYTVEHIKKRHAKMGYRNGMRQFYHLHIEDGNIFLPEHLPWVKCKRLDQYDALITYCDPSFKGAKTNDFKAIVLIGKTGHYYHVIWAWVRQASVGAMVSAHYDVDEMVHKNAHRIELEAAAFREVVCPHYMEANFMQDLMLEDYELEGGSKGYQMRIRPDKRKKPDKVARIEDLSPVAEKGYLGFNSKYRKSPDMIQLRDQFLAFPNGHDDGPDACEGGIHLLNKRHGSNRGKRRASGNYKKSNSRAA